MGIGTNPNDSSRSQEKPPENVRTFKRPERAVIPNGPPSKPPEAVRVSKHMDRMIIGGILAMMMYGLLLPTDWQERFGVLAQPIIWAAETVPSIAKMAHVSAIPELIQGFYGLGVYIVPLSGLFAYIYCGYIHLSIDILLLYPVIHSEKHFVLFI